MRSHQMTRGLEKAPHRSLMHALGMTREEMNRPLIGVVNSANENLPGQINLYTKTPAVKSCIRKTGGTPEEN